MQENSVQGSRYRMVRLLGSGGMGQVFEAQDLVLHRRVALKTLQDAAPVNKRLDRFAREAACGFMLHHPGIIRFYDFNLLHSPPYCVMELAEGETLGAWAHRSPRSPAEILQLVDRLLDALAYAHSEGVVHRDLKPDNILVTPSGAVKILDFGLASMEDATRLTTSGVVGTVQYMAP